MGWGNELDRRAFLAIRKVRGNAGRTRTPMALHSEGHRLVGAIAAYLNNSHAYLNKMARQFNEAARRQETIPPRGRKVETSHRQRRELPSRTGNPGFYGLGRRQAEAQCGSGTHCKLERTYFAPEPNSATMGLATAILTTRNSVMISMGQEHRKCQNGR